MLLQKIRAMNRNANKYLSKCTNTEDLVIENEEEELKEKTTEPVESPTQIPEHLSSAVQSESGNLKMGIPSTVEHSSHKQRKQHGYEFLLYSFSTSLIIRILTTTMHLLVATRDINLRRT